MNLHVLDTDMLTLFQKGHPAVCRRCAAAAPESLAITVIRVEEQFLGWYTRIRRANSDDELAVAYQGMAAFAAFIKELRILPFGGPAIRRYKQLVKLKVKAGKNDLRIGATALQEDATVVTRNVRDFKRVPDLRIEDKSQ